MGKVNCVVAAATLLLGVSSSTAGDPEISLQIMEVIHSGGRYATVVGKSAGLPAGKVVVSAAVLPQGDILYGQNDTALIGKDGRFKLTVQIGREGKVDVGKNFEVICFAYEEGKPPKIRFSETETRESTIAGFRVRMRQHVYKQDPAAISNVVVVKRK